MNKKNIDPDLLSNSFGIKYKVKKQTIYSPKGEESESVFSFNLKEKNKDSSMFIEVHSSLPNSIWLILETKNRYISKIDFSNITDVKYIPEYKKVIFESHTKTNFSILEVYSRGQFTLTHGWKESDYSKSVWNLKK